MERMIEAGLMPDQAIYNSLIDRYCQEGNWQNAFKLQDNMLKMGIRPTSLTHKILIQGLSRNVIMDDKNYRSQNRKRLAIQKYESVDHASHGQDS